MKLVTSLLINAGKVSDSILEAHSELIASSSFEIFLYFLTINIFAYGMGYIPIFYLVKIMELDRKYEILRAKDAKWYTMIRNENIEADPDGVFLSILSENAGKTFLYEGILRELIPDSNGNLEYVTLLFPARAIINSQGKYTGQKNLEKTDLLMIKYSEIKALGLKYIYLEPDDSSDSNLVLSD